MKDFKDYREEQIKRILKELKEINKRLIAKDFENDLVYNFLLKIQLEEIEDLEKYL